MISNTDNNTVTTAVNTFNIMKSIPTITTPITNGESWAEEGEKLRKLVSPRLPVTQTIWTTTSPSYITLTAPLKLDTMDIHFVISWVLLKP